MATPPNGNNNCKSDGKSSCPSACPSGQPQPSQPPPPALGKSMIDLVGWDAEMAALAAKTPASNAGIPSATVNSSAAAYEKLHEQMAHAAKESPENVEILSRLAQATYSLGLNQTDPAAVKGKTAEALALAEKVVAMDANNFRGHLWQAMAAGKLALLGCTVQEKIKYTVTFLRALAVCIRLSPKDPMVLFMEGRFQLALSSLTEEEKAAIKAHLPHLPPTVNWAEAEAKLRESIAANAAFLDGYLTLAYLLIKAKKYVEAKEVILKGLQQMVTTKSDEQMAAEMKTLQVRINSLVPQ